MSLDHNTPPSTPHPASPPQDTGLPVPIILLIGLMAFFGIFVALVRLT